MNTIFLLSSTFLLLFQFFKNFSGKVIDKNGNDSKQDTGLREKLQKFTELGENLFNEETKRKIENFSSNFRTTFENTSNICEPGSISRQYDCGAYN